MSLESDAALTMMAPMELEKSEDRVKDGNATGRLQQRLLACPIVRFRADIALGSEVTLVRTLV
jgi:hypothetical protein